MHPDSFVHEQPLPPYISMDQIATGEYNEYFADLWKKYPEDPTPEEYDDEYIEEYEDFEPAERLRHLLFDQSRREQFRKMFDLPVSEYDERLAEIIEDVRRLLGHEPKSTYQRSSSYSSSSSGSDTSSSDSSDSSDSEDYPDEPARGRPRLLQDRLDHHAPRPSPSSRESSDSTSSSESSGSSRLVKTQHPQFTGNALSSADEQQGPTNSGAKTQVPSNTEDNTRNMALTTATVDVGGVPENRSNSRHDIEIVASLAMPVGSEVVRNTKDSVGEMVSEAQNPTLAETKPRRGHTTAPMTEDHAAEQGADPAPEPAKKRRGPPKGPRAPPGLPTRSSTRISASASGSHPQISNNNVPVPTATDEVPHPATVTRTTRSRSKSTSGNVQATPTRVKSPSKPKRAASTANKPTTGSASKKAKQPRAKN